MHEQELSKEELILRAVKMVLTGVARDTATAPGLKHPLSDRTIEDMRQCLALISARERELAEAAGRQMSQRPRYVDEPKPAGEVVVPISTIRRGPGKSES